MFMPVGTEESTPRQRFPAVTVVLVLLNSLVFLVELLVLVTRGDQGLNDFILAFAVVPAAIASGQGLYTLLTALFVHGSLTHIASNMLFLLAFGDNVEDHLGRARYLLFYLLAGVIASFAQIIVDPTSPVPSVGASGAIAGILAAYLVLFPQGSVRLFVFLGPLSRVTRISALLYIGLWFVLQFFGVLGSLGVETAQTGGVAYWAHIGGFLGGMVLALLSKAILVRPRSPRRLTP